MLDRIRASLISRPPKPRWFAIAVVTGIAAVAIALVLVIDAVSARVSSQIQAGLEARARHGAQELAAISTLGVANEDIKLFNDAIDGYMASPDLQAIAISVDGKVMVSHGMIVSVLRVFNAAPGDLVRDPGYVASWAMGANANKIAVVMSTAAIDDVNALQAETSYLILALGAGAITGFFLVRRRRRHGKGPGRSPGATAAASSAGGASSAQLRELEIAQHVMQQLLEHASQGFVVVELAGQTLVDHAKIIERWFGAPPPEATMAGYLGAQSVDLATQLSIGAARLHEGSTDGLAQLPARMAIGDRTFDIGYAPILQDAKPVRLLIILNDITEQLARDTAAREAREARDVAALAQLLTSNRPEFDEFFAEAAKLVASLEAPSAGDVELGTIRTLRDNCAYYGLDSYVELCTSIEASLRETSAPMDDMQRVAVFDGWSRISSGLMKIAAAAR